MESDGENGERKLPIPFLPPEPFRRASAESVRVNRYNRSFRISFMHCFSIASQEGGVKPKAAVSFAQLSRELTGRRAGRRYAEVGMGTNVGALNPDSRVFASAKMASAKPNHDTVPAAEQ